MTPGYRPSMIPDYCLSMMIPGYRPSMISGYWLSVTQGYQSSVIPGYWLSMIPGYLLSISDSRLAPIIASGSRWQDPEAVGPPNLGN